MSEYRPGVREAFLTKHKLKLIGLTEENAGNIRSEINAMISIDGVWIDVDKSSIKIAYDASRHNIDEMRDIIIKHGADVSPDWWNQWKLSWDRDADQNIKDNATHEPMSCHKMPTNYKTLK